MPLLHVGLAADRMIVLGLLDPLSQAGRKRRAPLRVPMLGDRQREVSALTISRERNVYAPKRQ